MYGGAGLSLDVGCRGWMYPLCSLFAVCFTDKILHDLRESTNDLTVQLVVFLAIFPEATCMAGSELDVAWSFWLGFSSAGRTLHCIE